MSFKYLEGSQGKDYFKTRAMEKTGSELSSYSARVCMILYDFRFQMFIHSQSSLQTFQVPKMEGFLSLMFGYCGAGFSLT